ncbi:sulfonate ABC transporter substrate-binding protein [Methylopila jiangsuensis]|uniref:Putative aliphatic sulfonates-binding protein n=1 Tax=Methylopila jiangsuensis TaxID=586230 RepID=A0A9W6JHT8_9HYPH|nr:aliphatic sulfonate ABC transporter substrate-binding protein [Methylopila jiangsuensis]MDR6286045.1 aliphatic sulfonates family ABC transporter substrate-binding protein [Methylopila jiangsuensis]GLK75803.1 sulfonate ABC transporter substrate-binding protein [Methylopila jiangsuensis]
MLTRRTALATLSAAVAAPALIRSARADARKIRIGLQKNGVFLIARTRRTLEQRFEAEGVAVEWLEFTFGPPLLEALNVGSIDIGTTGDAPPIFAQAARGRFVYAATYPASGAAILVPKDSPLKTVADLKGKRIAIPKGSSAHNVAVQLIEKAGLGFDEVNAAYLPPADGQAAFARGSVDAWAVWDPFFAIAEETLGARVLSSSADAGPQNGFTLANRDFANANGDLLKGVVDAFGEVGAWADGHKDEVAELFSAATKTPIEAQRRAQTRTGYAVRPITPEVVATQQANADRFHRIGLIPNAITVADAVWTPGA